MTKDERQSIGVELYRNTPLNQGTFHYPERFGKTISALKAIKVLQYEITSCLVLVPSKPVKGQWEIHIADSDFGDLDICCLTPHEVLNENMIQPHTNMLVVDEIHKYNTKEYERILKQEFFTYDKILGLTATVSPEIKRWLNTYAPIIDVITDIEALENGWISPFKEYNYGINFPEATKPYYVGYSNTIKQVLELFRNSWRELTYVSTGLPVFKSDFQLLFALYTGTKLKDGMFVKAERFRQALAKVKGWTPDYTNSDNDQAELIDEYWNPSVIKDNVRAFYMAVTARNKLISNSSAKLQPVIDFINDNQNSTIIFSESTEFANNLFAALNLKFENEACVYHSNLQSRYMVDETGDYIRFKNGKPKKFGFGTLKKMAIDGLKSGKYKYLATVKTLSHGIDIPNLQQVVITAGTVNPIDQKQRSGRVKTIDPLNSMKEGLILNIYFRDFYIDNEYIKSRDLTKLIQRQKMYSIEPIWIDNLNEISN